MLSFVRSPETILDVGCGPNGRSLEDFLPEDVSVVGIDLYEPEQVRFERPPNFTYFRHDARDLSRFGDQSFDVAISIGMMEHICDRSVLLTMAREIERVARQWVILVPWRYAWLEPHFKVPFFGAFPVSLQRRLITAFNLHDIGEAVARDPDYLVRHYQWLTNEEWLRVWPGSSVHLSPTRECIAIVKSA